MKSFTDFEIKKVETPQVVEEETLLEALDYEETDGIIVEAKDTDPPPILIMRRKAVRMFPNGQKVALYYVDKIHKYVTVPYEDMLMSSAFKEQFEKHIESNIMESLKKVASGWTNNVILEDKSMVKVDVVTAKSIIHIYENLNEDNQKTLCEKAGRSRKDFKEIAEFANKH
jgi:hypothetical protein